MRITALTRGGCAAYGGHYDPHRNEVILQARDGESRAITIEYPSPPTNVTSSGTGSAASNLVVSGNKASFTLSGFTACGWIDINAMVGGETRLIRIRANLETNRPSDYGSTINGTPGELDWSLEDGSNTGHLGA